MAPVVLVAIGQFVAIVTRSASGTGGHVTFEVTPPPPYGAPVSSVYSPISGIACYRFSGIYEQFGVRSIEVRESSPTIFAGCDAPSAFSDEAKRRRVQLLYTTTGPLIGKKSHKNVLFIVFKSNFIAPRPPPSPLVALLLLLPLPRPTHALPLCASLGVRVCVCAGGWVACAFADFDVSAAVFVLQCGSEHIRGKDDVYNTAVGACLAGGAAGMKTHKISHMCAGCLGGALIMSAVRLG